MALPYALAAILVFSPQQDSLADGLKALDANQPAAAEALFRQAVQKDSGDVAAHFNLALALSLEQKDDEAIRELERTLALQPGLYPAEVNLGTLLLRNMRAPDALPVLKDAVSQRAKELPANLLYAQALDQTNDFVEADRYFRAAIDIDPKSAAAQSGLANCLLKESKPAESAEHFRAAAALDPRYKDDLLTLAAEYEKLRKVPDAIAIYRQFPENSAATQRAAQLLAATGNSADAVPALEQTVKQSPTVANRLALADAYKSSKQTDKVIEQLQMAAAAEPNNFDIRMDLGRELRDLRRFVPAAQQFTAAAKIRPDSVKAWNELASVLVVSEDYAGGLAALDHVRALGQEGVGDYFYRAISLEKLKQPKPALEAYRQFLAADGGKNPDQEFQARQRIRIIESELNRR